MQNCFLVVLILFLMTLAQIATDIYLPSFPAMKVQLLTTSAYIQLTFSVFLAGFAISQLFYGPLSDRYGRKSFLLIGVFLYFIMSVTAAFTNSIEILLLARALQGIGAGACSVIPRAIMSDKFSGAALERMTIYQSMVWSIVPISAPLLGSYIQQYLGWRFNFLFLALISLVAFAMCLLFKETHIQKEKHISIKSILINYQKILSHKQFILYLTCAVCPIGMLTAFNISAPLLIQETLHLSALQYGWSIFFVALSFIVGTLINRWSLVRKSSLIIVKTGIALMWIASVLLVFFGLHPQFKLFELLAPIFILQIGCACVFPFMASKIMELFPHIAGKAAAVFGCSIFFGSMLSSIIMSLLSKNTLLPLAVFIFVLNCIMLSSYQTIVRNMITKWEYLL